MPEPELWHGSPHTQPSELPERPMLDLSQQRLLEVLRVQAAQAGWSSSRLKEEGCRMVNLLEMQMGQESGSSQLPSSRQVIFHSAASRSDSKKTWSESQL